MDESGFLLIPNVRRTWAPRGQTPHVYHWFKQDKISAFGAITVSPQRRHVGLYIQFRSHSLKHSDVKVFLQYLLRHLRGPIMLLWDRGMIHRHHSIKSFLEKRPRLHSEFFPAYAPELNPAEYIWNRADFALANTVSNTQSHLHQRLHRITRRLRSSQKHLWACIHASGLPWKR